MGFLFLVIFILPLTLILLLAWLGTKNKVYGIIAGIIWIAIIGLIILGQAFRYFGAKTVLKKNDYYGQYVIKRDFFPGKQTEWQYNKFRFEIKSNDSIFFYVTDSENILNTYKGTITTVNPYGSERLVVNMNRLSHHILKTNPTIYRDTWSFYLVFYSQHYGNVFFEKGEWEK